MAIPWRVMLTGLLLLGCKQQPPEGLDDLGVVPQWSMTAEDGKPIGSAQLQGKVWVANFLFTSCPTSCPPLARATAELQDKLQALVGKDGPSPVQIVSISVDPETDTPAVLSDFARKYHANPRLWHFATTGNYDKTEQLVAEGFGQQLIKPDPPQPGDLAPGASPTVLEIAHSLHFVVIDRAGHIRGTWDKDAAGIAATLAAVRYLAEL